MRRLWFVCSAVVVAVLVALNWHHIDPRFSKAPPLRFSNGPATPWGSLSTNSPGVASAPANSSAAEPPETEPEPETVTAQPPPSAPAKTNTLAAPVPAASPEQGRSAMAKTLAGASNEALAKVAPDTLKQLAEALGRAPETTTDSSDGRIDRDKTPESGTVVQKANGVEVRALSTPPPPTALPASGLPLAETDRGTTTAATATTSNSEPLRLILEAPAADLAEIPVLLLARALTEIDTSKLTADSETTLPAALAAARAELKLDLDARTFVTELTRPTLRPIAAATADHFVRADQKLDLGLEALPPVKSIEELQTDGLDENRTVTRVRITHRLEPIKPAELLVRATRSPSTPIRVLDREQITEIPLAEALRRHQLKPTEPIVAVREVRVLEPTTLAELKREARLKPGERPQAIAGAPKVTQRTIEELLGPQDTKAGSLYYVRTVQRQDVQGIWGIIQAGLIDNFARGMAIARGDQTDTYQVHIPRLADEPLTGNRGSSFLGRMIFQKMRRSTIYNIKLGRIATKPENIMPGQQIVIVDFSPDELIAIYRHFARTRGAS